MRRLTPPTHNAWDLTHRAALKLNPSPVTAKVVAAQAPLTAAYAAYVSACATAGWYTFAHCAWGQSGQLIMAGITKAEFNELYSSGVVNGEPGARGVYDDIILIAGGKCPYCGGIGHVGCLDHYLPKARYPSFSVLPINLIPCCEKCNKLSGSPVFVNEEDQTINPYFDDLRYFEESWIGVEIDTYDILSYRYVFSPPDDWPLVMKRRAQRHFEDFALAIRYGTAASGEIGYIDDLRVSMSGICTQDTIRALLESKANCSSFDLNGWQRPLYRAVSSAQWFLDLF